MPEDLTRKTRARAFLMIAAGVLGIVGFLRQVWGNPALTRVDLFVLLVAAAILGAGVVTLLRSRR